MHLWLALDIYLYQGQKPQISIGLQLLSVVVRAHDVGWKGRLERAGQIMEGCQEKKKVSRYRVFPPSAQALNRRFF